MTRARLRDLYKRYLTNNCTEDELVELSAYLNHADFREDIDALLDESWTYLAGKELPDISNEKVNRYHDFIVMHAQPKRIKPYLWLKVAASIIILLSFGLITYLYHKKISATDNALIAKSPKQDIMPGGRKATLTLNNGHRVTLDSTFSGQIAQQNGAVINKNGQLIYSSAGKNTATTNEVQYNTITVAKGGEYGLILADGTHVYLNSASSLTYPTGFNGTTREVSLTGEGYFEVAKNPKKPFKININNKQQLEVLGTHFNIKAYDDDEDIATTLIEGSVKLFSDGRQAILKPGQTAVNNGSSFQINQADLDEVMAWRNGIFIFNNENITSLMKRIGRWYNVDVVFQGNMKDINFIGTFPKSKSLASLMKNIELTEKVQFVTEGRRITVIEKK